MNDRFRFRAWDKEQKKMFYNAEMTYDYSLVLDACEADSFGTVLEDDNMIVMQCTGLKDKNDKLIYEEDIVRFKDCNDILVVNFQKEMACFAPQFYCDGKYGGRLWFDNYNSSECQFYKSNNFEVIGNIYENPDLLEE